jgi:uncharacterized membrane protein YhdT
MDELELLKKDWQRKSEDYPKLSYDAIHKMSHAKSSSIVKWIFYISLLEFVFLLVINILNPKLENQIEYPAWIDIANYLTIPIVAVFIFLFYKNYKTISATDSVKKLIKSILKTRKTVKYYVLFNLVLVAIFSGVGIYLGYVDNFGGPAEFNASAHFKEYATLGVVMILCTVLIIGLFFGVYYLLYGILLKRLNKNYQELRKLEV